MPVLPMDRSQYRLVEWSTDHPTSDLDDYEVTPFGVLLGTQELPPELLDEKEKEPNG